MIYFIHAKTTKRIKIGYTRDKASFVRRFQALSGANADTLKVLGMIRGGRKVEREWHAACQPFHHHNEWFSHDRKLMYRIRKALKDPSRVIHIKKAKAS